jgi:hypothetical protein
MSLGGDCLQIAMGDLLQNRILGPVDNFGVENFSNIVELFDGSLFIKILNKQCDYHYIINDNNFRYQYGNYHCCHVHLLDDHIVENFKERVNNFNNFLKDINEPGNYFMYSLSIQDRTIDENLVYSTLDKLPFDGRSKIIITDALHHHGDDRPIPTVFWENFKCMKINFWYDHQNSAKWEK